MTSLLKNVAYSVQVKILQENKSKLAQTYSWVVLVNFMLGLTKPSKTAVMFQ